MNLKKLNKTFVLTFLFSFFLFNILWSTQLMLNNISFLFQDTFLDSFRLIVEIVDVIVFQGLLFLTVAFMVGSIMAMIAVFIYDVLLPKLSQGD